jgi:hypothetical protein
MKTNPLELSDEEFLNMNGPEEPAQTGDVVSTDEDKTNDDAEADETAAVADEDDGGDNSAVDPDDEDSDEAADSETDEGNEDAPEKIDDSEAEETSDKDGSAEEEQGEEKPLEELAPEAYKAFYEKVMAPFKANGKTIVLHSEEEAIQLMQMGANYTKKLQDIQPHRKVLLMLQNNDLLDEGKLSFLIDLEKRDPKAIQKLIKDSGIDPMDIDTDSDSDYQTGNHAVSDSEVQFRGVLEEITSSDTGKQTIQVIQQTWDQTSKEVLWSQPEILKVMHEQRESGVYARITSEIDRQKVLGKITPTMPFLEAYQLVGNQLYGQPDTAAAGNNGSAEPAQRRELDRRPAKPKLMVKDGDKAKAASTTKSTPRATRQIVNPLTMSDEEFLKLDGMRNRL